MAYEHARIGQTDGAAGKAPAIATRGKGLRNNLAKKMRVYELARELGLTNKEGLDLCLAMGIGVTSHSSSIEEAQADRVRRRAEREGLKRAHQPEEPAPEHDRPAPAAGRSSSPAPLQTPTSPSPEAPQLVLPQAHKRRRLAGVVGRGLAATGTVPVPPAGVLPIAIPRPCPAARVPPRLRLRPCQRRSRRPTSAARALRDGRAQHGPRQSVARRQRLPATAGYRPPPGVVAGVDHRARLRGLRPGSSPVRPSGPVAARRTVGGPGRRPRPAVRRPPLASGPHALRCAKAAPCSGATRRRRWPGSSDRPGARRRVPRPVPSRCRHHPPPGPGAGPGCRPSKPGSLVAHDGQAHPASAWFSRAGVPVDRQADPSARARPQRGPAVAATATGASGRELRGTARAGRVGAGLRRRPGRPYRRQRPGPSADGGWASARWAQRSYGPSRSPRCTVRRGPGSLAPAARVLAGREARGAAMGAGGRPGGPPGMRPGGARPLGGARTGPLSRGPDATYRTPPGAPFRGAPGAGFPARGAGRPGGGGPGGAPAGAGEVAPAGGGHAAARPAAKSFRRSRRPPTRRRTRPSPRARS